MWYIFKELAGYMIWSIILAREGAKKNKHVLISSKVKHKFGIQKVCWYYGYRLRLLT
jgi:hypothetical protein